MARTQRDQAAIFLQRAAQLEERAKGEQNRQRRETLLVLAEYYRQIVLPVSERQDVGIMREEASRVVLKLALRKAFGLIRGLTRQISDKDEDLIVLELLERLDVAGYEIRRKQRVSTGLKLDAPQE
ncbi:MAG TPA: hypothetical protein VKW08_13945 [Xanthobacteraceae bacterium]|jgi:hypothetical protein|nr:hypothetical protein [Xanthobacteraceae bacterium]